MTTYVQHDFAMECGVTMFLYHM